MRARSYVRFVFPYVCVFIFLVTVVCSKKNADTPSTIMTGMVETAEIDVAAKVPGRVAQLRVEEGQTVTEGDTIAILESRQFDAKVGQALGGLTAAQAKLLMAKNGLRPQEKEAADKMYLQAKAQADLMEKTWQRIQKLAADSVVSGQERDQVEAQYLAAQESMEAARSKLSLANEGSRTEDRTAAAALVSQAEQAYKEAVAWRDEQVLLSPVSGEVFQRIVSRGEVVNAGAPVVTIINTADIWVVLNVKETSLNTFRQGSVLSGTVPALGDSAIRFAVTHIAPMGDFATWRPTSQKGGFDIKTFEVHLRPLSPVSALRAGMSVNFKLHG
jgi:HlyD family secretion protein